MVIIRGICIYKVMEVPHHPCPLGSDISPSSLWTDHGSLPSCNWNHQKVNLEIHCGCGTELPGGGRWALAHFTQQSLLLCPENIWNRAQDVESAKLFFPPGFWENIRLFIVTFFWIFLFSLFELHNNVVNAFEGDRSDSEVKVFILEGLFFSLSSSSSPPSFATPLL